MGRRVNYPWFKFDAAAWLTSESVARLTWAQRGVYVQVLASAWASSRCSVPADFESILGCSASDAGAVRAHLVEHPDHPGRLTHEHLLANLAENEGARARGRRGASARWPDHDSTRENDAVALRPQCAGIATAMPRASSSSSSSSSSSEEGESEGERPKRRRKPHAYSAAFEAFWSAYPRREGKGKALAVWSRLGAEDRAKATEAATAQQGWPLGHGLHREDPNYLPHASTWLTGRRFDDEPPPNGRAAKRHALDHPDSAYDAWLEHSEGR